MLSAHLRLITRSHHQALERAIDLLRPDLTRERYVAVLSGFYGFYLPLESALDAPLSAAFPGLLDGRRKAAWIARDLESLGVEAGTLPLCRDLPDVAHVDDALGVAYVLEGSTLGGAALSRLFRDRLGIGPLDGGAFFASYGPKIPEMWRNFLTALDGWRGDADRTVRAAAATFDAMARWMGERSPA